MRYLLPLCKASSTASSASLERGMKASLCSRQILVSEVANTTHPSISKTLCAGKTINKKIVYTPISYTTCWTF